MNNIYSMNPFEKESRQNETEQMDGNLDWDFFLKKKKINITSVSSLLSRLQKFVVVALADNRLYYKKVYRWKKEATHSVEVRLQDRNVKFIVNKKGILWPVYYLMNRFIYNSLMSFFGAQKCIFPAYATRHLLKHIFISLNSARFSPKFMETRSNILAFSRNCFQWL